MVKGLYAGLPKKPKSGFMFFALQRRMMLKDELPGLSIADCSKVIGGEWRDLSDSERAPFQEMAAKDKQRYLGEKSGMY